MSTVRDKTGKFKVGNPGKPKGASKNLLRDKIRSFIDTNWENLPEWFEKLKPKEKIDVLLALAPYAVSKLQSVSLTDPDGGDVVVWNETKTYTDYTKLSEKTLKEVLRNTKTLEKDGDS